MGTNIIRVLILVTLSFCTIFSTCRKGAVCSGNTTYSFKIGADIMPDKDSIHINDTFLLTINCQTNLQDINTATLVDFSKAKNFGFNVRILQFLNGSDVAGAINKFKLLLIAGTNYSYSTDPNSLQEYLFSEQNNSYQFKLGVVPLDTGKFVLTISNAANVYRSNDNCNKANFEIDFQNTNQHFSWLQRWRPDLILDDLGKLKVYYFKVY